jgi:sodium-dependent dicarboxylate transporter 2/3/5
MARFGKLVLLLVAVVVAVAAGWALHGPGGQPREVAFMGAIFVVAALLWTTEAMPLFATALLVVGLQIIFLANPGGWSGLGFHNGQSPGYQRILAAAVDPVLLLFFGGFLLAHAAAKEGVDRVLSALFLRPFGTRPAALLFGVMLITAVFSMWMSNTATTAMMLAVIGPVLVALPAGAPLRTALLLGVPFAANLGGLATPIGTPPNLVAIGFLEKTGHKLSFLGWMVIALPVAAVMLAFTWWLLLRLHPSGRQPLTLELQAPRPTPRGWIVIGVFVVTVLLWLTDTLTGLPAPVVALLPAVVFAAAGILGTADLKSIEWDVLLLIGGGVSLGVGMQLTGLDRVVVSWLPLESAGGLVLIALLVVATVVLSTFMSNTAAANLLLPVGVSTAVIAESVTTFEVAVATAMAASMAMALPISTPPNAIAYGRGGISTRDMAVPGAIIGVVGTLVVVGFAPLLLRLLGAKD